MAWENETPKQVDQRWSMRIGNCRFSLMSAEHGHWMHVDVYVSRRFDGDYESAKQSWPREAITAARAELDEAEQKLREKKKDVND